jgi:hypothetical protein
VQSSPQYVAVTNALYLYDELSAGAPRLFDTYEDEIVRDLDVNWAMSPVCVVVATAARDRTAVLGMATLAISVVKVASISGTVNLFAGSSDRLLFVRHVGGSLQLSV